MSIISDEDFITVECPKCKEDCEIAIVSELDTKTGVSDIGLRERAYCPNCMYEFQYKDL